MKIVQLFTREKIESDKFRNINEKHQNAWLKTVWYNSIFFSDCRNRVLDCDRAHSLVRGPTQRFRPITRRFWYYFRLYFINRHALSPVAANCRQVQYVANGNGRGQSGLPYLDTDSNIQDIGTIDKDEVQGDIKFTDVRFGYLEEEEVLHGISFEVKKGETVAIVGATGAGKSTIINLLGRFYEINSGCIEVDGIDIKDFKLTSLRSHIAVVLQDVFLFADTIANNISSLKDPSITVADIQAAAKAILVDEFITSLPGGYEYNVKERGSMLSSGQRQLIAFLRAYVSNPSILVLG